MFTFNSYIDKSSLSDAGRITAISPISPLLLKERLANQEQSQLDNTPNQQQIAPPEKKQTENQKDINLTAQVVERELLLKLRARDMKVRRHEQAHAQAAGPYLLQGPRFTYQKGPDNKLYAIGGQVQLDISKAATPEETAKKAATLKRAALAPATPSPQDLSIARKAEQMLQQAHQQLQKDKNNSQTFTAQGQLSTQAANSLLFSLKV